MKISRWGGAAALGLGLALAAAAPAAAQDEAPDVPYEVYEIDDCELTIVATNPTAHTTYLVVDVAGEVDVVELAPEADGQSGPYRLDEVEVQYRLFGGPERDYDSPGWDVAREDLESYLADNGDGWVTAGIAGAPEFVTWHTAEVTGCEPEATPSPSAEPSPSPSADPPGDESPAPGAGGELAQTGMPTGLLAGGAVALLGVGGGAVWLARRRRVSFTA